MYIKRFIAAVMAVCCALSAFSCNEKKESKADDKETVTEEKSTAAETTEASEDETENDSDDGEKGKKEKVNITEYITVDKAEPAMWKVTDPETGNVLYMLGTMHMITEDTFPLPDYIMDVYNKCDGIAVEYDISGLTSDMKQMQDFYAKMVYTDGTTVKDHISADTYEKLKKYMTENYVYNEMMDSYTAGFWVSQVESLSITDIGKMDVNGVDARFIEMAQKDNKEVISIETIDIQAKALTAASDELSDYMISDTIDKALDKPSYTKDFAEMYDTWASGDVDGLDMEEDVDELPDDLKDDYAEYADIVLYDRNGGMADKAEEFLKNGKNYFFMVGAAHFAGSKGVDDLLEAKGYKVERVSA